MPEDGRAAIRGAEFPSFHCCADFRAGVVAARMDDPAGAWREEAEGVGAVGGEVSGAGRRHAINLAHARGGNVELAGNLIEAQVGLVMEA